MNVAFTYAPGRPAGEIDAEERESDDSFEMANLRERDTGVPGVIYISTRQGSHGPRIKWYPRRARGDEAFLSVTLEDPPRVLNHGVPAREAVGVTLAAEWAALNRDALLRFWSEGATLDIHDVLAFAETLRKLP